MMYLRKTLISSSLRHPCCYLKSYTLRSFSILFFSSSTKRAQPSPTLSFLQPLRNTTAVSEYLLNTHNFSPETALKASSCLKSLRNIENSDSVLLFLRDYGLTHSQLELVVSKNPRILCANLDCIVKPKINIFEDSGFAPNDIAKIIYGNPWLLTQVTCNALGQLVLGLKNILGSDSDVIKALERFRFCFDFRDYEETWIPNIEFLKKCGVSSSQISQFVCNFPTMFLHKPATFKELVKKVEEMGLKSESKMFLYAIRTFCSMSVENWERKCQVFQSLGFSEEEVMTMFRRMPPVFMVSERKLKEVTEILLTSTTKMDISVVVTSPTLLMYSVESRLKPRLQVLEIWERDNLRPEMRSYAHLFQMSDQKFFQKYVLPYADRISELKCRFNEGHRQLKSSSLVETPQTKD